MDSAQRRLDRVSGHMSSAQKPSAASSTLKPAPPATLRESLFDEIAYREKLFSILSTSRYDYQFDLSTKELRESTFLKCRDLLQNKVISVDDVVNNPNKAMAFMETVWLFDPNMGGVFSSHFGLFGSSVLGLGTRKHRDLLANQIDSLSWLGALALTELGHGSNVNGIETTAHYDVATKEFILNTPTESAQKIWVGGATTHTRWCVVYAQLHLAGKNEGVHAFLVPIRNDDGTIAPSIRIADHGAKFGQNGVDSGRIWFDSKRIPRDYLLDKFAQVSEAGVLTSQFRDPAQRFAATVSPLIFGRIAASGTANHVALLGLKIATRYSFSRTQFKAAPGSLNAGQEVPIISYMSQKRRLYPFIAASIAYLAAGNHVRRLYAKPQKKKEDWKQIHVLSAGIKAVSTWHKAEALQLARECVGGQGFAMVNRIAQLRAGTEIDLTLEGDNTVLLQQVSKQLLKKNGSDYWMRQAANNSAASAGAVITGCGTKAMDNRPFLQAIFEWRVHLLLKLAKERPEDATTAASLSLAFVDMISLHELFKLIDALQNNSQERTSLEIMARLFVAFKLERDLGLIVSYGGLSRDQAKRVLRWVNDLCDAVHPSVLTLLDVPPVPDPVVRAPIAFNYVERHQYGKDLSKL